MKLPKALFKVHKDHIMGNAHRYGCVTFKNRCKQAEYDKYDKSIKIERIFKNRFMFIEYNFEKHPNNGMLSLAIVHSTKKRIEFVYNLFKSKQELIAAIEGIKLLAKILKKHGGKE